ncbi:hypothetical protein [Pseudoalteromonas sp. BDTF-M6]|uniref:hypothetical protein n=1 Tax=Pseudoalteromonas sp. BDTF-M6 TaxID=2796132 RepID=UPI001BAF3E82|nr:hypothetical protein [Pseudoalteromonas sp. BDTF-M6]MBS3798250.1 hypothetical protein [Pseudoalteromonas sp. BDTF-M6]
MRIKKNILQPFMGVLILAVLCFGAYFILSEFWVLFSSIDAKLGASLVAASATILVSVFTVVFSKRQEGKLEIDNQLREKKIPIYEKIIEFIFLITFADKLGKKQPSEKQMIQFFTDTTRDLVIWGSKEMVDAFGDFRDGVTNIPDGNNAEHIMATVEDLLLAVRKDLGHKHKNFKRGEILRLYINDIDDYFQ